jgi:hypothetical protein
VGKGIMRRTVLVRREIPWIERRWGRVARRQRERIGLGRGVDERQGFRVTRYSFLMSIEIECVLCR